MFSKCANSNICLEHLHSLPLNANAVNGWSVSCDNSTNQTLTDKKNTIARNTMNSQSLVDNSQSEQRDRPRQKTPMSTAESSRGCISLVHSEPPCCRNIELNGYDRRLTLWRNKVTVII